MILAGIGILGNGLSAWLLHRGSKKNINIRGPFFICWGSADFRGGLDQRAILIFKPWYWLDPLLSLLIVVFILKNCWSIITEATAVLMNATPKGIDIQKIKDFLKNIPEVCSVHYLHAWNVSSSSIAFSCHVEVNDQAVSQTEVLAEKIRHELYHRFGIDHPILQFETVRCGNGGLLCEIGKPGLRNACDSPVRKQLETGSAIKMAPQKSIKQNNPEPFSVISTQGPSRCACRKNTDENSNPTLTTLKQSNPAALASKPFRVWLWALAGLFTLSVLMIGSGIVSGLDSSAFR